MALPTFEHISDLTVAAARKLPDFLEKLADARPDTPIKGARLADELDITLQQVAALRRYAWEKGHAVGSSGKGYYLATTPREFQPTCEHHLARERCAAANSQMVNRLMQALTARQQDANMDMF